METIKAADNLVIVFGRGLWQLTNGRPNERPLLVAAAGAATLIYQPAFAQARRLPASSSLGVRDVREVIVGWSRADRAWHLGLLLGPDLARERGGRWCELARWPDDQGTVAADQAGKAGASLAAVIERPFRLVQAPHMAPATGPLNPDVTRASLPSEVGGIVPAEAPPAGAAPKAASPAQEAPASLTADEASPAEADREGWARQAAPTLAELVPHTLPEHPAVRDGRRAASPESGHVAERAGEEAPRVVRVMRQRPETAIQLPLNVGGWLLRPVDVGLQWVRTGVWSLGAVMRIAFRIVLGIVFISISVLTLQSPYAPVQPVGLPYLGILIGVGLIYVALRQTMALLRTEAVVVDTQARQVRRHLDLTNDVVEAYDFSEVRAVVVTQVAQQKHRGRNGEPDTMTHEAWLHLLLHQARQKLGRERRLKPQDAYVTIGHVEVTEGEIAVDHFKGKKRERRPHLLYPDTATTPAQKAALALAQAIGVDAYIDQR